MAVPPRNDVDRTLVVVAHPDDVDFGAGGTVAAWTRAGIEVAYCICTSGDAGGFDGTPREQMPALREAEQRAAAKELGVSDVTFLGFPDGALVADQALRRDISRQIRRFRPQRVLAPSPEINWTRISASHPDHRATGEATLAAIYPDARNPFAHPELLGSEGLAPWSVAELWLMASPTERLNHAVDVTDTFDVKIAALRAHQSQTAHLDDLEPRLRRWLTVAGERFNLGDGRLGEVFQIVATG